MAKTNTNNILCFYTRCSNEKMIDSRFIGNIFDVYINEIPLKEENNIMNINISNSFNIKYGVIDNITVLPSMIFSNVEKLINIKIPDIYTKISNKAFFGASNLSSIIMRGVTSIGSYAFDGCSRLKELDLSNVVDLYNYSLAGCGLKTVNLTKNPEQEYITIYPGLFKDCKYLKEYSDNQNDYYLGECSFSGCTSLEKVIIKDYLGISGNKIEKDIYLTGASESYEGEDKQEENIDSPTTLPNYIFSGCSKLKNISFLDTIENIGIGSLIFCSSLENINAPIKSIDKYGLKNCINLKTVDLSQCVSINEYALQNCNSLLEVDLSSLENIEDGIFDSCDSLESVLNNNLTSINDYMFRNCTNLMNFEGFSNITEVGKEAFMNCQSLPSTIDLSNIINFGDRAFMGCKKLNNITLNENVELGESVFENCIELSEITIPEIIESLPDNLFKGCKKLSKITINYHDDSDINLSALEGCNNISYINIVNSERYITPNNNCIYDKQNHQIIYVCKNINLFEINNIDYNNDKNITISDTAFDNCLCNIILIKDIDAPIINSKTFNNIKYKNFHILINKNDKNFNKYYSLLGKSHIYSYIIDQEINDNQNNQNLDDSL